MEVEFKFEIKSVSDKETYLVTGPEEDIKVFIEELFTVFECWHRTEEMVLIIHRYSADLRERLQGFVSLYSRRWPQLNGLWAFVNKLSSDEYFLFLPMAELSQMDRLKVHSYLKAMIEGAPTDEAIAKSDELFGLVLDCYSLQVFGRKRLYIGEPIKSKRTCRFCNKAVPETSFDCRAHAISESIGNKTIFLYEECDICNARLGKEIEQDMAAFFSVIRTFYGIRGKGGTKPLVGKNFTLTNVNQLMLSYQGNLDFEGDGAESSFYLEIPVAYSPANIYKALCKYFLSVISSSKLPHFKRTVDWVNGRNEPGLLPKMAILFTYIGFKLQPELTVYLRKNGDTTLPYAVGDFSLATYRIVFIMPFVDQDDRAFDSDQDFDRFWNLFRHFKKAEGWSFEDFSSSETKDQQVKLTFIKKNI